MILAGDVGGTKTLLGLFDGVQPRPQPITVRGFSTLDFDGLGSIVSQFVRELAGANQRIDAACFGVAGPVIDRTAELTNVPWKVDARQIADQFGIARVDLLNDLQAMAHGLTVLDGSEIQSLQSGEPVHSGNIGLIAAGTGLGIAMLHNVDGRYVPAASEGGHADFAARSEREIRLLRWLTTEHGRAEVEGVISGRGLLNIYRVTHEADSCPAVPDRHAHDAPAEITTAALEKRCPGCVETLDMFVEAYGAEAGNLALRTVATGGLFVGGGIAPKILPALTDGRFMRAFRSKAPFEAMLSAMPVNVILNAETGLLGAAVFAAANAGGP
jgi:glucokinase